MGGMGDGHPALVHVHGGSVLLERLRSAQVPGQRLEWCDPVGSGPTPGGLSDDDWYETRAAYLASAARAPDRATVQQTLRRQDQALRAIPADAELVIWAGPELFCQAILMRLLVLLSEQPARPTLSLVDPGAQPGSPGCGLSTMSADALRIAFESRRRVPPAALALAGRAWQAFTSPTAGALTRLIAEDTTALPHLGAALERHLADLPDGATGLSTSETRVLEELDAAPLDLGALLSAVGRREQRPFLTDTLLEEILQRLGAPPAPLVGVDRARMVHITRRGRSVLAGHDFWSAERWHGGIHIRPEESDPESEAAN